MDVALALIETAARNERDGEVAAAELLYRGLLEQQPAHAEACLRLGVLLSRGDRIEEALVWLQRAASQPSVELYATLGDVHRRAGRNEPAVTCLLIASLLQAAALAPPDAAHWLQLGLALHQAGPGHAAARAFLAALLTEPGRPEPYTNLGTTVGAGFGLMMQRRAVRLAPRHAAYHTNLAHSLLEAGQYDEGFAEWEWRTPSPPRDFSAPRWNGQDLAGRTLLVHAEQGYGDSIQFCRYVPRLAGLGARVVIETRAPLAGLLGRLDGVDQVTLWGETLPPFDYECPLPSLAARFPWEANQLPYLRQDRPKLKLWRQHLKDAGYRADRRNIGLVWSGNPRSVDPHRAIDFATIATLAYQDPEARFFSLQYGVAIDDAAIRDLAPLIQDFDDVAAALFSLDLLISVDTAAAHLAGALGRPVWVLLHKDADWRWRSGDGRGSDWYPSARIYRQTTAGDWHDVLGRVAQDLMRGK